MEDKGFEPLHELTRLTVFETVPFSQTWVILRFYTYFIAAVNVFQLQIIRSDDLLDLLLV